jgi:acetone carboxylase gamma subunit
MKLKNGKTRLNKMFNELLDTVDYNNEIVELPEILVYSLLDRIAIYNDKMDEVIKFLDQQSISLEKQEEKLKAYLEKRNSQKTLDVQDYFTKINFQNTDWTLEGEIENVT